MAGDRGYCRNGRLVDRGGSPRGCPWRIVEVCDDVVSTGRLLGPFRGVFGRGALTALEEQKITHFCCFRFPALFCLYIFQVYICVSLGLLMYLLLLLAREIIKPSHSFDTASFSASHLVMMLRNLKFDFIVRCDVNCSSSNSSTI